MWNCDRGFKQGRYLDIKNFENNNIFDNSYNSQ